MSQLSMNPKQFLWVEKYRPQTVQDTILPKKLKATFQEYVDKKNVGNLMLSGVAGVGKTTVAKAMLNEIGCSYIVINGSKDRNIDTLRTTIANFASTRSLLAKGRKFVILDEGDYLNPTSTQPALRNFMEEFSANCGFILTCNYKQKIIPELHSRFANIEFVIPEEEKTELAVAFFRRILEILDAEGVEYDRQAVAAAVKHYYPDWRKTLNELQNYATTGRIDSGILASRKSTNIHMLIEHMREKKFTDVRKWVAVNAAIDSASLYRQLYDELPNELDGAAAIAEVIVILAQYQYQEAFVANPEINRVAALATIMSEANWK